MPSGFTNTKTKDGRWAKFWSLYVTPTSKTFNNATQSAIAVGFSKLYANRITTTPSFRRLIHGSVGDRADERRARLLNRAEDGLEEFLNMPVSVLRVEKGDEDEQVEYVVTDPSLVKIKQDTAKFVAERLGKAHYSARNEQTGANGGPIQVTIGKMLDALEGEVIQQNGRLKIGGQSMADVPLIQNTGQEEEPADIPAE